ncbi:uncharacterized protein LOC133847864 [Drosophila sulfurigaster albostrigata]|uniref:uncharacterized protein LOC133847864 n=1 Tax=Drosophila sulfurigaster albostrigata TaxID=89887 RepID=UPI002D218C6D|nr:uncharacterized protein LOC133847864 [Drosophila sulfurigaster albostrigata]
MLKDQPTFKEVAKVFIVGLALRSYIADGDGQQRRTCFGHELSRRICIAANRHRPSTRYRLLKFMSPERLKDYDMRHKEQRDLRQVAHEFASKSGRDGGGDATPLNLKHNQ